MLTRRSFLQLMGASTGVALTGAEFLSQTVANAAPALSPHGSNGIEHVVLLMMENRSFDHFLGWLPGARGRHDRRSEEHTSELQSQSNLVCRLLLEKKNKQLNTTHLLQYHYAAIASYPLLTTLHESVDLPLR